MHPFEMVVIIVFLALVAGMFKTYIKHKSAEPPADDARIQHLEERVRVLEQIVTDSGYELRRQFRDLERDD
ncbi:MAG: hypothetical protein PVI87_07595 [Gammaproteobacteria bacterium]